MLNGNIPRIPTTVPPDQAHVRAQRHQGNNGRVVTITAPYLILIPAQPSDKREVPGGIFPPSGKRAGWRAGMLMSRCSRKLFAFLI